MLCIVHMRSGNQSCVRHLYKIDVSHCQSVVITVSVCIVKRVNILFNETGHSPTQLGSTDQHARVETLHVG